jgi:hypothetical protein
LGQRRLAGRTHSAMQAHERKVVRMSIDTGMVVVVFISLMYMVLVFGLLFYVKNDWCDLLFKNFTVSGWLVFIV